MMIVQSRRIGIIAKLTLVMLVILGFGISRNSVYACNAGEILNARGECVLDINPITPKNPCTVSNPDPGLCQARKDGEKIKTCISTYGENYCNCKYTLKGIYLNTEVPFIGDPTNKRCLVMSTAGSAPVNVLRALTKILMTFVMIGGFGMIVWGGVQIAGGDVKGGKDKIIGVAIAFALLGSLGVILRFINPNFFS